MEFQNLKEEVIVLCHFNAYLNILVYPINSVNNPLSPPEQNNFVLKIDIK